MASRRIGKRNGSYSKLSSNRRLVERRLRKRVGVEQCHYVRQQGWICNAELAGKRFSLFRWEFERETESGFYLLISFWRHKGFGCLRIGKRNARPGGETGLATSDNARELAGSSAFNL